MAWTASGTKRPFATKVVVLAAVGERRWAHYLPCDRGIDVIAVASGSRRGKMRQRDVVEMKALLD